MLSISSCEKGENEVDGNEVVEKEICNECHCQVENPLTELEWLKKEIERLTKLLNYELELQANAKGWFDDSMISLLRGRIGQLEQE